MKAHELEEKLKAHDDQLRAKDEQIASLTAQLAELRAQLDHSSPRAAESDGRLVGRNVFSTMPPGLPTSNVQRPHSARARAAGGSPARTRPVSPGRGAAPLSTRTGTKSAARPASPRTMRRSPSGQRDYFHASQRGGRITDPLQWRGLTVEERQSPYTALRGPALLTRDKFGAKRREERLRATSSFSGMSSNLLLDDNPHNDPLKYAPFKGSAFPPSDYVGPEDARETDDLESVSGGNALQRGFVFGYCGRKARSNLFYNADGRIVYHVAALGIVYDKAAHEQLFFDEHDDDITCLALHPDKVKVVSGQVGKTPKIFVWSSRPDANGALPKLCLIHDPEQMRAIIGVSFSSTGAYVAAMGYDNNRSIGIYKWAANQSVSKMRIGMDKGHNADVYCLAYNPVTDHAVAVGKKYIRFFGVKAAGEFSHYESPIWAKKGVFGSRENQQDMMCVAFGTDGVTYAGTADGFIYRFVDQAMDFAVKAHPLTGDSLCKVTALWFNPHRHCLISSGDDGALHIWQPSAWGELGDTAVQPLQTIDLHRWVNTQSETCIRGIPLKLDEYGVDKDEAPKKLGSAAAAHSLCGDDKGRILVGTVCNEIYEIDPSSSDPPMCLMQGHYNELWGLAAHPSNPSEFCTTAEDGTLRVWDLTSRTMRSMRRLAGPGRSCAYSPDGGLIAVGIGVGGKAKGRPSTAQGQWFVFRNDDELTKVAEPPQIRAERIADIKFSPSGRFVAVASADNFIDIYSVSGVAFEHKGTLQGHSSYVRRIDWSVDSTKLQSCCGAYELLYWKLWKEGERVEQRWRPHQEKSSSSMRDEQWASHSCLFGWPVRGIWPEDTDGTDINAVARSNLATAQEGLVATADDFGKVKLFRWPCIIPRAAAQEHSGHSAHVTNIEFTADDSSVMSTGGNDRAIIQWRLVRTTYSC